MNRLKHGFTLVEIMIVVAIIGLLVTMAMPAFIRARDNTQEAVCINNLRMLLTAKTTLALETELNNGDTIQATDLNPYLKHDFSDMAEPSGFTYELRPIGQNPICLYGGSHVY